MKRMFEVVNNESTWSASGTISNELAPRSFTVTRMAVIVRAIVTTTSVTMFNDGFDRIISRLNLTGSGKTFFDFSNMRAAYHAMRLWGCPTRRPALLADSLTTTEQFFAYVFHFGLAPFVVNPLTGMIEDNPYDLTAGIMPTGKGALTLGGSFAAAATVVGTNVTVTDADLDIYLWGVQPEAGDAPSVWMPRAFPIWSMETPTPTATSSAFGTPHDIPSGDFLHSIMMMLTNGSNAPRDDSVLTSLRVINTIDGNAPLFQYGRGVSAVTDFQAAEILSQFGSRLWLGYAPNDNVTTAMDAIASGGSPGAITVSGPSKDAGLVNIPLHLQSIKSQLPQYGIDYRTAGSGALRMQYGVADATGVTMDLLYRRYQLNPEHPANAGLV